MIAAFGLATESRTKGSGADEGVCPTNEFCDGLKVSRRIADQCGEDVACFLRVRDRRYSSRERGLENAVRERTEELERERSRERSRNRILEMLVANQPLGAVLDHIAELVAAEVAGSACAILLRQGERVHVASAHGASHEMREALSFPHAVPYEVWKGSAEFGAPAADPAWASASRSLISGPAFPR